MKGFRLSSTLSSLAAVVVCAVGLSIASASHAVAQTKEDCLARAAYGYAKSEPDHNVVGNKPYYITIESLLYRCGGGNVMAKHIVHFDSRWLDPGTQVHLRISTKRSDGEWVGADRTIVSSKNRSDEVYYQTRRIGGGQAITDVHVKHFAEPGQTSFFPPSTAKAVYGPWNGPEARPRG